MKIRRRTVRLGLYAAFALVLVAGAWAQQAPTREITQIVGDLYRFQNNFHFSVFLVTPDGVIATDPIDAEAAQWLKSEIAKRFNKQIKYVIYSHHHADHASGGEVFADTATLIGHENMPAAIKAAGITTVRSPDEVYSDRRVIRLGGKTVELYHFGRNHSDNSTIVRFPDEKVIFTVDFITVKRLPFRTLNDSYFPDWIDSVKRVEELDFEIVAPGHGPMGTRADVVAQRRYLEALTIAVQKQIDAGRTVEQAQSTIKLEEYRGWNQYETWLAENVAGAYRILSN